MKPFRHLFLLLSIFSFLIPHGLFRQIPVTGLNSGSKSDKSQVENLPSLQEFASKIKPQSGEFIRGIYVKDVLANEIVQQPPGNPGYISREVDTVTQFGLASQFGTIGLLAHNSIAGIAFFNIVAGDIIYLIQSTGELKAYSVSEIQRYQALIPTSQYSDFVNLNDPQSVISAQTLFLRTYGRGGVLVLQTCIEEAGESSWGRLFIIAEPLPMVANLIRNMKIPAVISLHNFDVVQIN